MTSCVSTGQQSTAACPDSGLTPVAAALRQPHTVILPQPLQPHSALTAGPHSAQGTLQDAPPAFMYELPADTTGTDYDAAWQQTARKTISSMLQPPPQAMSTLQLMDYICSRICRDYPEGGLLQNPALNPFLSDLLEEGDCGTDLPAPHSLQEQPVGPQGKKANRRQAAADSRQTASTAEERKNRARRQAAAELIAAVSQTAATAETVAKNETLSQTIATAEIPAAASTKAVAASENKKNQGTAAINTGTTTVTATAVVVAAAAASLRSGAAGSDASGSGSESGTPACAVSANKKQYTEPDAKRSCRYSRKCRPDHTAEASDGSSSYCTSAGTASVFRAGRLQSAIASALSCSTEHSRRSFVSGTVAVLIAAAMLACHSPAAQAAESAIPAQTAPQAVTARAAASPAPAPAAAAPQANAAPLLQRIELSGNAARPQGTEQALQQQVLAAKLGRPVSAALLQDVLHEVSRYLQQEGFADARALLPEQVISSEGKLQIYVAGTQLHDVLFTDESSLRPSARARLFAGIEEHKGSLLNFRDLEGDLLKLSDLGIISIKGEFEQTLSTDPLMQDLHLNLTDTGDKNYDLYFFADNHGTEASGRYRFGSYAGLRNFTRNADTLSLFYARSSEEQNNYSLSYKIPVNSHPTVIGASVCYADYDLAREYADLGAQGKSITAELFVQEPLYRTAGHRLDFTGGYRYRDLTDEFAAFDVKFEKHSHAIYAGLSHALYQEGSYMWSGGLTLTAGKLYNDDEWELYDEDIFRIVQADAMFSFLDVLIPRFDLAFALEAQYSPDMLDSSEQFFAGGADAVEAYDSNIAAGDSGVLFTFAPVYQPFASVDFTLSPHVQAAIVRSEGYESEHIMGTGLQLQLHSHGFTAKLSIDTAIGDKPWGDVDDGKVWFEVGYRC